MPTPSEDIEAFLRSLDVEVQPWQLPLVRLMYAMKPEDRLELKIGRRGRSGLVIVRGDK